jgi:hypothetical protein
MADAQVPGEQCHLQLARGSIDFEPLVTPARLIAAAAKEGLKTPNGEVARFNDDVERCHAISLEVIGLRLGESVPSCKLRQGNSVVNTIRLWIESHSV